MLFIFPKVERIKDPLLSRLVFFARYESYMRCVQVRGPRLEPMIAQRQNGSVVELEAVDDQVMKVVGQPVELSADEFSNWILVPDTEEGRQAQLTFDDYRYRRTARKWALHRERAESTGTDASNPLSGACLRSFFRLFLNPPATPT